MNAPARLGRRAAVARLLVEREGILTLASLGGPAYDLAAATGETPLDFCLGGAMGGASAMGLGLAIAQPGHRIAVFVGDGEMLMSLTSLATIGAEKPDNMVILVIDNEHYAETGMQRSHTGRGVDICRIAEGAGFAWTLAVSREEELDAAARALRERPGPGLISLKVGKEPGPEFKRIRDGAYMRARFRQALLGQP